MWSLPFPYVDGRKAIPATGGVRAPSHYWERQQHSSVRVWPQTQETFAFRTSGKSEIHLMSHFSWHLREILDDNMQGYLQRALSPSPNIFTSASLPVIPSWIFIFYEISHHKDQTFYPCTTIATGFHPQRYFSCQSEAGSNDGPSE